MVVQKPSVRLRVDTFRLDVDDTWELDSSKFIDHSISADRKWLANHIHWGVRNEKLIQINSSI